MVVSSREKTEVRRLRLIGVLAAVFGLWVIARLFTLQIWQHNLYTALAAGTHEIIQELIPERGSIFIKDGFTGRTVPVAVNRDVYSVIADTRKITDNEVVARAIDDVLRIGDADRWDLFMNLENHPNAAYVPILKRITENQKQKLQEKTVTGIRFERHPYRYYPEGTVGAHVIGFFGLDEHGTSVGNYGIEGFFNDELSGEQGAVHGERDALGAWIPLGKREYRPAKDGVDITLTIDRTIQNEVCTDLARRAQEFEAAGAAAVVMDPKTGAILSMCSYPLFDPNTYNEVEDIQHFNNRAIFTAYEPGSIFKPLIMAAALDREVLTPETTFEDEGEVQISEFRIKNAGNKKYGEVSMRRVIIDSINTGMIFVAERLGAKNIQEYVEEFDFGEKTGVRLHTEVAGDVSSLEKDGFIFAATASYGQGITATPLQMVQAYSAIANGGKMTKPYLVEYIEADGEIVYEAKSGQHSVVLSPRSAAIAADMMAGVIDEGTSWVAGVDGYRLAGKTGTAQIAAGAGYGEETNQSFIGFGPVEDPKYIMIIKFEKPNTRYATYSAAPVFGELSRFILQYMQIPPSR